MHLLFADQLCQKLIWFYSFRMHNLKLMKTHVFDKIFKNVLLWPLKTNFNLQNRAYFFKKTYPLPSLLKRKNMIFLFFHVLKPQFVSNALPNRIFSVILFRNTFSLQNHRANRLLLGN